MGVPSTRLRVRVSPGSRRVGVAGRVGETWKLRVTAPAEGGRANAAVLRLLAETLGVARDRVVLVSGHGARDKVVELDGIEPGEVERRLTAAGEGG
jgi:uncharacterized protein (TIGR00251 family)